MKRRVYFFLLLAFVSLTFNTECRSTAHNTECTIYFRNNNNLRVPLHVEIANTDAARQQGLMFRKNMKQNYGMIFVFQDEKPLTFWMKNTYIPLSIAYVASHGVINEIYNMKPLDISITYPSLLPARYAIEVNKGWFEKNQISEGCRVEFNGCISK
ncbi:MAG TPA: DUF192 domain-containing protein [Spirochaetota bacterium]|nr:DUF192 domain-containing protein [Spirochaetota bacterium]